MTGFSGILFMASESYGFPSEEYEKRLPDNMYSSARGILEYTDVSSDSCMFLFTNYSVKLVNSTNHSLLDLDGFQHNYFAVIGNHNDVSYEYLQMELPSSFGDPSYLIDLKNQDGTIHGGLFTGYENLAVLWYMKSSSPSHLI